MGEMVKQIAALQDYERYQDLHWEGSFEDYLQIVRERPQVTRNAFQRLYDMVVSYGEEEYIDNKKKLIRYPFFKDPIENGKDAIFGLDIPLMRLVHVLHAAAQGYGPEKRIILLHGPVGSSKSTIARLLKKGLERYSRTPEGALYTYEWTNLHQTGLAGGDDVFPCPMHDEPLRLIPPDWRDQAVVDAAAAPQPGARPAHLRPPVEPLRVGRLRDPDERRVLAGVEGNRVAHALLPFGSRAARAGVGVVFGYGIGASLPGGRDRGAPRPDGDGSARPGAHRGSPSRRPRSPGCRPSGGRRPAWRPPARARRSPPPRRAEAPGRPA